jgi:DNA-binding PadR family transcriptional regulator
MPLYPIDNNFTYHEPKGDQPRKYQRLREKGKEVAAIILDSCPDSRERSLALTKLEEAIFWANASIARNE